MSVNRHYGVTNTRLPSNTNGFLYKKPFRVVSETLPEGEIPVASISGWRLPTLADFCFYRNNFMNSVGTPLLWGGFAVVVVIMLAIDLLLQGRKGSHTMSMKQAAVWSLVWVSLSLLFNAAFWWYLTGTLAVKWRIHKLWPSSPVI